VKVGSLFAGIGGLDIAVERAFGAETVWQLDLTGHTVRRRHWPRARQIVRDVTKVDPAQLEPVDILIGGFPCQDLSVAGTQEGLEGSRSGLYREVLRFVEDLGPRFVVMENVCALLTKYRERLEGAFDALGYGLTWVDIEARSVGAPHIRRRVFVVAERGTEHRLIDTKRGGDGALWPTPLARDSNGPGAGQGAQGSASLGEAVRHWPTPTATNPNDSEDLDNWQARSDRLVALGSRPLSPPLRVAVRLWPTPVKGDDCSGPRRAGDLTLSHAARLWPTPTLWATPMKQNAKSATVSQDCLDSRPLGEQVYQAHGLGGKLNPEWVEALMGFPQGWTRPMRGGDLFGGMGSLMPAALSLLEAPRWPRGRPPKVHTGPWAGHKWEPDRTLSTTGNDRRERLAWLGNAVCPQQALAALRLARS